MFQKGKNLSRAEQLIADIINAYPGAAAIVRENSGEVIIANELYALADEQQVTFKKIQWLDESHALLLVLDSAVILREEVQKLYNLAYLDGLTQVPNRTRLKEDFRQLEPEVADGKKHGTVAIFDLDYFKSINDTYGHNIGDIMLQKVTEQIQENPAFKGHLYRLGGDEFAFLFAEETGKHPDIREYYGKLLAGAINTYKTPNIDAVCTISMGASFFPQHGGNLSSLLHKADIALYKAKAGGRNRLALFEDEDEIINNLKDLYISLQPVLDGAGKTFGYELTEGSADREKRVSAASLIDFNRTLDILGLDEIDNNKNYFISYTKNMSAAESKNRLKNKLIIQIDDINGDEKMQEYRKLKELGFTLAFSCPTIDNLPEELLDIIDYVKFVPYQNSAEAVKKLLRNNKKIVLIGNQINNSQQLAFAKKVGCVLYQGHYFKEAKTVTEKTKDIEPLQVNYYRLLKLTCTDEYVDFQEISDIISSDLALSFRLLKLMNSVAMGIKTPIESIPMALTYMGEERLKKWISLMSLRGISPSKPIELIRISLIRAKFGENLVPHFKVPRSAEHVFMAGMMSLLHIALDKEQKELLDEISLAEDIRESLLSKKGKYSDIIAFFKNYEYSNWEEVNKFAKDNGLNNKIINDAYLAATKWYDDLTQEK